MPSMDANLRSPPRLSASLLDPLPVMSTNSSAVLPADGIKSAPDAATTGPPRDTQPSAADTRDSGERILILAPGHAERHYWRDLWHYRELFAMLAWRDVAVRYKQTVIGVAWAIVRPLLTMVIFTIVFGKL